MTRISKGTVTATNGSTTVTAWSGDGGVVLSEITAPAGSQVVIEGVANFIASRTSTTEFELVLPHAGAGGTALACAISAMTATETSIGTLNARTATVLQELSALDANGPGLFYNLIGVTGANDPGPGKMAFNNATPASVTELYLDVLDANDDGRDVSALIDLWKSGTVLIVRSISTTAYAAFQLTAEPTDSTGYRTVAVTALASDGTLASEPVTIEWSIAGTGVEIDAIGSFAGRAAHDGEAAGYVYASADGDGGTITTSVLFRKNSGTSADWSTALPFQGEKGDTGPKGDTGDTGPKGDKGDTGDITGLTAFWQNIVTVKMDAPTSRSALGIAFASQAEAEEGTDATKYMNPLATKQAIAKLVDLSAVAGDVVPDADSARDLGSVVKAWAEVYADKVLTGQVAFPATQNPSTDANTLDDYEEGTYTPVIFGNTTAGTGTYSTQRGSYTKIGRHVSGSCDVAWTAHTGTGNTYVTLPFPPKDISVPAAIFPVNLSYNSSSQVGAQTDTSAVGMQIVQWPIGGAGASGIPIDTAATIRLQFNYDVA